MQNQCICDVYFQIFNVMLTNDIVNFEQLAPGHYMVTDEVFVAKTA